MERRLAAIMFVDIVGYTALMAESEAKGLRVRERHRALVRRDRCTRALWAGSRLDPIRDDPRFTDLVRRIGIPVD